MLQSIVTHPGSAHQDEFLACSVLLSENKVPIIRREPTNEDLADPRIAVVDVGGEHRPENNNFDHHQFPKSQEPACALSLVLQHLDLYEDARKFCPWLEIVEWFDCRGPDKTAQFLETDRDVLVRLNSPINSILIRRFASQAEHKPGELIWEIMYVLGKDLVSYLRNYREKIHFIETHAEIWELENNGTHFKVLFMPRTNPLQEEVSSGLFSHVSKLGLEEEILALIYPDSRGKGYGLRRFKDTNEIDFRKLESEVDVHFTHTQGFIAKTTSTDHERLKHLIQCALGK